MDVLIGQRIVEIHTGSFSPLKQQACHACLKAIPLTLVHPIAQGPVHHQAGRARRIRRAGNRLSTDRCSASSRASRAFPKLVAHPNFTLEAVITIEEEVRVPDVRRNRRRGGWSAIDRRLVEVLETHRIESMGDLFTLLDAHLPEEFTTADLASAMQAPRRLGQQAAFCLREAGVVAICGKDGNALRYRRCEN